MNRSKSLIRKLLVVIVLLLFASLISACWSRHELNELSIVVGLAIDKKGDRYNVTVQIVNPSQVSNKKAGSSSFSPVVSYEATGVSVPDALSRMTVKAARQLYYPHLRILIIGEDVARSGISKPLDFIARNREMRTDFYLIVAKGTTAGKILNMYSPIDPIPANNLYTKLETSDRLWAATGKITLDKLIQDLSQQGKGPTLTAIEIEGNPSKGDKITNAEYVDPEVILKYSGMVAFKLDRMAGWLNENDSKALNYIQNSIIKTSGIIACPESKGNISLQIVHSHANIRVNTKSGAPEFEVILKTEQDITDISCELDITQPETFAKLNKLADKKLEEIINRTLHKFQKQVKVDIFGFGSALHRSDPKMWHGIKDWDKTFENVKITVHSHCTIRRIGTTVQSVRSTIKK
ncbi:Ger(x)C family spore germination protein [Paenibacillus sp. FJAT-27812]|uniref:Ger(x)C family spore germination protein n=1 Tax=Paenibacillus sp. FJAT-27812 TaxID=1684143 RepID=UPI0006A78672|nr:Ger(x)C family spore germination protein [Paenibacillus sp. FJAT-27812]